MQSEFQSALEKEQLNILPVLTFQSDDLMEKLKLLNYEKQLLKNMKLKPLSRFYFVKSVNPGEQFFMFTSICAWLIQKLGKEFEQPQEFDDPNQTIGKIIKVLQEIDIPTEFPTNKLILGAGPICLFVLDSIATQAIKISKITLNHPQVKQEEENAPELMEDSAEIILEKVEEEQSALLSDDSDNDDVNSLRDLNWTTTNGVNKNIGGIRKSFENNGDNFNEAENWRLELERVLPQLKVVVKADARDWRAHLKQMELLKTNIETSSDDTQNQLRKLQSELTFTMDKVESREKHLNNELNILIKQFKDISIDLFTIQSSAKETDKETEKISKELLSVISENDNVKSKMEQRGQSMSDGSPVINIKKGIAKLKEDIAQLNLEMGLLNHSIDQDYLRQAYIYAELEAMPITAN